MLEARLCSVHPFQGLGSLTGLQHLDLWRTSTASAADTAALLGGLQQLQLLTYLDLERCMRHVVDVAAYAALSASSKLRSLTISGCELPQGMWQHIAANEGHLLCLTRLMANLHECDSSAPFITNDMAGLATCCPALLELDITGATDTPQCLRPLVHLTALDMLNASNVDDAAAAAVLAHLTRLVVLDIRSSTIHDIGLLQLTTLVHLTRLTVSGNLSKDITDVSARGAAGCILR